DPPPAARSRSPRPRRARFAEAVGLGPRHPLLHHQQPLQRRAHHHLHHEQRRRSGRPHRRPPAQPAVRDGQRDPDDGHRRLPPEEDLKRNPFDVIRRGFENAMANWPVILLRIGEGLIMIGIVIAAVFAAVVPVVVAANVSHFDTSSIDSASQFFAELIIEHWMLLLYLFLLSFVIFGLLIALHSFVEAGSARVYIDGERAPGFRAFAFDRWWAGGRRGWWPVFWIYNLAWSVGGLIILVPPVITIAAMLLVDANGARIVLGCAGLAFTVLLLIPTAF